MEHLNIEIKARCTDPGRIRQYLLAKGAVLKGTDQQTDTYFHVPNGRLKLREGNIENNLIFYERENLAGPRDSRYHLVNIPEAAALKTVLAKATGIRVVVAKKREIWFIGNVKFHIDEVEGLGSFVEIEAGNLLADLPREKLQEQCDFYRAAFGILDQDLVGLSYSDLLAGQ